MVLELIVLLTSESSSWMDAIGRVSTYALTTTQFSPLNPIYGGEKHGTW